MSLPVDKELNSQATLEELTSGRSLMDGVIPNLPEKQQGSTRLAFGSCQYPGGFVDESVAYDSYRELWQRLHATDDPPRFLVLTGDQVYVDATAGLFDPSQHDGRYVLPYQRWLRARSVRNPLRQLHSFMLLDDHEIEDNWEPPDKTDPEPAFRSYLKYQQYEEPDNLPPHWFFDFVFDDLPFFMLDTRSRRSKRTFNTIDTASILDTGPDLQLNMLTAWMNVQAPPGPKFVISPSMVLPRHRNVARWDDPIGAFQSDGWDGYPASLHAVLAAAAEATADRIVFLSGDEHHGCVATITVTNDNTGVEKTLYSIHSPGLYTPFPFANSLAEDWLAESDREFQVGSTTYRYTVTYTAYPGNGFVLANIEEQNGTWTMTCEFPGGVIVDIF